MEEFLGDKLSPTYALVSFTVFGFGIGFFVGAITTHIVLALVGMEIIGIVLGCLVGFDHGRWSTWEYIRRKYHLSLKK